MRLGTDKAAYEPGGEVYCTIEYLPQNARMLQLTLNHLTTLVWIKTIPTDGKDIHFVLLQQDFTGYLLRIDALDDQEKALDTAFIGVDCSSDWTKFHVMNMYGILRKMPRQ